MVDKKPSKNDNLNLTPELDVLEGFFKNSPLAFTVIDPQQRKILWTSRHTRDLFSASSDNHHAHVWKELFRNDKMFDEIVEQLKDGTIIEDEERVFLNEEGKMFVALLDFSTVTLNDHKLILADVWDITARKQAEANMSHEAEADKLLSNITSQLLDINTEDATYNSLKNLGVYFAIDTIIIQEIQHLGARTTPPLYWSASAETIETDRLIGDSLSTYPWFEEQLLAGRKVSLSSPKEMPKNADAERQLMARFDIKSLLIIPILFHRNLVGIITVENKRQRRKWKPRETDVFIQYGNAIGSQIVRQQSEENLRAAKIRAEEALSELEGAQDQLIRVEKMAALGDMVAGIAHETNTPLGIAVTTTSTLRAKSNQLKRKLDEGKMKKSDLLGFFDISKEGYLILENNLQRAAELIRSFKRIAVDVTSSSIQTIELGLYIDDILLNIHPRTKKFKNIHIAVDCPIGLRIQTDPGALAQIITNLTLNALIHAYGDDVSASGDIIITAYEDSGNLKIIFTDDGTGISDEIKARIFEPYFTTNRDKGGSGLGMSIICNLVEKTLKGSISVKSKLGKGTGFTMTFPMKVEA